MDELQLSPQNLKRLECRLQQVLARVESPMTSLEWSTDGESLVVTHGTPMQDDQQLDFWNWREPRLWLTLGTEVTGAHYWSDLTWSHSGRFVAMSATRSGPIEDEAIPFPNVQQSISSGLGVEVRQIIGPRRVHFIPFESPEHVVNCVSWSSRGTLIVVAADERLRIFDATTSEEVLNLDNKFIGSVIDVCFHPSQSIVAVASDLGEIKLFETDAWQLQAALMAPDGLFTIRWSPDGSLLGAATQNGPILLYSLKSSEPIHTLQGHSRGADRVSFSADGKLLASIGRDNKLRLWDTMTGQELVVFGFSEWYFPTMWVFHPLEMVAAVWNQYDQQVEIWEVPSQLRLPVLQEADEVIADYSVAKDDDFSAPEGQIKLKLHIERERNRELVKRRKQRALEEEGCLRCEACGFVFVQVYGKLGEDFIECHHTKPVAELKPGEETSLNDLVLVCSNCHRMLHRGQRLLTIAELQALIDQQRDM